MREVTFRKTPIERQANWTAATRSLPDQIADDLLRKYLINEHQAVIFSFLELLKIPLAEGMIEESLDLAALSNEQVEMAACSLLGLADRVGVVL